MKHKINLPLTEIEKRIDFLKKQRDGLIIGDYRNSLAQIFETINHSIPLVLVP